MSDGYPISDDENLVTPIDVAGVKLSGFITSVTGVTYEGRQSLVKRCTPGMPLLIEREPKNPRDRNAVMVCLADGRQLGYLSRNRAAAVSKALRRGRARGVVLARTGGGRDKPSYGLNIAVVVGPAEVDDATLGTGLELLRSGIASRAGSAAAGAGAADPGPAEELAGMAGASGEAEAAAGGEPDAPAQEVPGCGCLLLIIASAAGLIILVIKGCF